MNSANTPEDLEIVEYFRKSFPVGAVQVSETNIQKVADWCGGTVENPNRPSKHVKVEVHQPMNERQTKAFIGDWVLYMEDKGFKVFTKVAFEKSFQRGPKPEAITVNVFQGGGGAGNPDILTGRAEGFFGNGGSSVHRGQNPGGNNV